MFEARVRRPRLECGGRRGDEVPCTGSRALAEADQRILGSNYGSVDPRRDFPWILDLYMEGRLPLDELVTARRTLGDAEDALQRLATGEVLRTLLVPDARFAA
jgi:S-(hydroxymethyl)glutathione dehydrogenase/alcohol dehydrogenase